MLSIKDKGLLLQIIKRCERILEKVERVKLEDFVNDEDLKEIISFNIFQIGELVNCLSDGFIEKYNNIPWKLVRGMRNRIVHGYDTVNVDILWNTANESIKELLDFTSKIIL